MGDAARPLTLSYLSMNALTRDNVMTSSGRAAEIRAEGVGKSFGSFVALSDISLTIGRG